jgi:hypothetical protein
MNISFRRRTIAGIRFAGLCARLRLVSGAAALHRTGGRRSVVLYWRRKRIARSHDRWRSGPSVILPVRLRLNLVYGMTVFTPAAQVANLSRSALDTRMQFAVLHHHIDRVSGIRSEFRSAVSTRMADRNSRFPGIPEQSSSPSIPEMTSVAPVQISLRKLHATQELTRTVFRAGSERIDHIRTFKTHTSARYRERETLYLRHQKTGGAIAASVPHAPAPRVFAATPELVWRKTHQKAVHAAPAQPGSSSTASLQPMAPELSREHKQAVPLDAPAAQRANFQPVNLDPRMLDRLAEDVIHRVERRIRIERERRGLL